MTGYCLWRQNPIEDGDDLRFTQAVAVAEIKRQGLDGVYQDRKARNKIVSPVFCSLKTSQRVLPSHKSKDSRIFHDSHFSGEISHRGGRLPEDILGPIFHLILKSRVLKRKESSLKKESKKKSHNGCALTIYHNDDLCISLLEWLQLAFLLLSILLNSDNANMDINYWR